VSALEDLHAALVAVERRRLEEALEALLRVYAARRVAEIGELIEKVSLRLPEKKPIATARGRDKFLRTEKEQRAADVPSQLDAAPGAKSYAALAQRPPDPRIAESFVATIRLVPERSPSTKPFYQLVLDAIVAIAEPRSIKWLREARAGAAELGVRSFRAWLEQTVDAAVAALEARVAQAVPLAADEHILLEKIRAALVGDAEARQGSARTLGELEAAVYEHPDDDGARSVFADALQEAGDARGELISLQLTHDRELSPKERARVRAILRDERDRLLGEIAGWVLADGLVFERGFPARARIRNGLYTYGSPPSSPRWATFVELDAAEDQSAVNLLDKSALARSLEILRGAPYVTVAILERVTTPLKIVELQFHEPAAKEALPKGSALERLARLVESGRLPLRRLTLSTPERDGALPPIPDALVGLLTR
jgi:uncharacterized protein (TIGR02996 family)